MLWKNAQVGEELLNKHKEEEDEVLVSKREGLREIEEEVFVEAKAIEVEIEAVEEAEEEEEDVEDVEEHPQLIHSTPI